MPESPDRTSAPRQLTSGPTKAENALSPPDAEERKVVLEFLRDELGAIASEYQRPGWSVWLILAGLAGIGWLLLAEYTSGQLQHGVAARAAIALLMFVRGVIIIIHGGLETHESKSLTHSRFFSANASFGPSRAGLLYAVLMDSTGIILLLCSQLPGVRSYELWLVRIISTMVWFFLAVVPSMKFIASFYDAPLKGSLIADLDRLVGGRRGLWFGLALLQVGGLVMYTVLYNYHAPSVRIGVLYATAAILVQILVNQKRKPPLVDELIRTRRSLVLENSPVAEAKQTIDAALYGLRLHRIVQDSVAEFLSIGDDVLNTLRDVKAQLEAFEMIAKDPQPTEKSLSLLSAVSDSVDMKMTQVGKDSERLQKPLEAVSRRLGMADPDDPDVERIISLLQQKSNAIKSSIRDLRVQLRTLAEVRATITATVAALKPAPEAILTPDPEPKEAHAKPRIDRRLLTAINVARASRYPDLYEAADARKVMDLDEATNNVLDALGDPRENDRAWRRLGFMGRVTLEEVMPTINAHWPPGLVSAQAVLKALDDWLSSASEPTSIESLPAMPLAPQALAEAMAVVESAAHLMDREQARAAMSEILDSIFQGYAIFPGSKERRALFDWWLDEVVPAATALRSPRPFDRRVKSDALPR